jgi:hypothetical protein
VEIWALCRDCDRWFYCADWFDKTAPAQVCPVCGADPSAIVNRAACVTEGDPAHVAGVA